MPRDSGGNAALPPGYLAVTGQTVMASQHNAPLEDIASMLTGSLPRNGSAPMNANLPMAGFKITGLGDGAAAADAVSLAQLTSWTSDPWSFQPIGTLIPLLDNIAGIAAPPKDKAYRYVKLTASDAYNTGVLTTENVTGSAPLVVATAVISLSGSPFNGRTINLINTERRFLRAGSAGTVENDALENIVGSMTVRRTSGGAIGVASLVGAFKDDGNGSTMSGVDASTTHPGQVVKFDASLVARTSTETRSKNIGVTYYMRIK